MIMNVYLNIFERDDSVKAWLTRDDKFVLEENRDTVHDTSSHNKVRIWKERHDCKQYFNCSKDSNLSVIENCFKSLKDIPRKTAIYDTKQLKEELQNAWNEHVTQEFINAQVLSMPQRMHDVIKDHGTMTGW